jgi:(1->4)-alpha-D-glucan 1-alpha-D-glucosylmutase
VDVRGIIAPDANEEYFIYQTLVGAWPFDAADEPAFHDRLLKYLLKALREAKVHTSWLSPDEEYEHGVFEFVQALLDRRRPFLDTFRPFEQRIAELGVYNSLAQLVIKVTAPGIPDFYQGTELWDLSLVDPDNRRPVDYDRRRALLAGLNESDPASLATLLLEQRRDGRVKLMTMVRALAVRSAMRDLFQKGDYVPLATSGAMPESVFAFARRFNHQAALTCVPRLVARLVPDARRPPLGREAWGDTRISVRDLPGLATLRDAFTGLTVPVRDGLLDAAEVFSTFPVALLVAP